MTTSSQSPTIVLDFDGTITEVDLLQEIASHFGDPGIVDEVDRDLDEGRITLQDEITREYEPVTTSLEAVVSWALERVRIRAGFLELVALARARGYGLRILSSGFHEIIEPVLRSTGVEGVEIVANRVDARPDGWRVVWRDETVCEVCGEPCKRGGLPAGETVYVGDGISDRCAALAAQRVFATRGLARYLDERGAPFEPFVDFHDIVRALTD